MHVLIIAWAGGQVWREFLKVKRKVYGNSLILAKAISTYVLVITYLSPFKFRLPLIFAPFNFRLINFRHPLLNISLPLIFATF